MYTHARATKRSSCASRRSVNKLYFFTNGATSSSTFTIIAERTSGSGLHGRSWEIMKANAKHSARSGRRLERQPLLNISAICMHVAVTFLCARMCDVYGTFLQEDLQRVSRKPHIFLISSAHYVFRYTERSRYNAAVVSNMIYPLIN